MKKSLILLALIAASYSYAGDNVPGNCGNGSGNGNGCTGSSPSAGNNANKNANANRNSNRNNAAAIAAAGAVAGSSASADVSTGSKAENNLTMSGDAYSSNTAYRASSSTAFAPAIPPTANCTVSSSFGVQGMSFGLAGGAATVDEACATIEQAKAAQVLGQPAVAQEVLCSLPKIREARKHTGHPCWVDTAEGITDAASKESDDPYIAARQRAAAAK